jgi:uncharacterized protein (DUF1501 family)
MLTRRQILKGLLASAGLSLFTFSRSSWALSPSGEDGGKHFIMILMRGAVDGLSVVVPHAEPIYYERRPNIALVKPGQEGGLIELDGFFGLHPSLAAILPYWQDGSLAFIQASGSPAETRSHFEAQDIMETALLNSALAKQGWMNALAQLLPDNQAPARAISVGNVMPKIFQGPANISSLPNNMRAGRVAAVDNPHLEKKLEQLYALHPELKGLFQQAMSGREMMMQDLQAEMVDSAKGAPVGDAFVAMSQKVGDMIHHDPRIQLVFMDAGGWDTHVEQGNAKGQLANKLEKFGQGLATLIQRLGPAYKNTSILVMSEFGRTVSENGNKGTDHGHGNVAWLFGGNVQGGKVYGVWPGLNHDQLWEGRDLAVTTDFRAILGEVLVKHFALNALSLEQVISGYIPAKGLSGMFKV